MRAEVSRDAGAAPHSTDCGCRSCQRRRAMLGHGAQRVPSHSPQFLSPPGLIRGKTKVVQSSVVQDGFPYPARDVSSSGHVSDSLSPLDERDGWSLRHMR
jgi:hypothetical protein